MGKVREDLGEAYASTSGGAPVSSQGMGLGPSRALLNELVKVSWVLLHRLAAMHECRLHLGIRMLQIAPQKECTSSDLNLRIRMTGIGIAALLMARKKGKKIGRTQRNPSERNHRSTTS